MIGEQRLDCCERLPPELRHGDLVLLHASPGNVWKAPMDTAEDAARLLATYSSFERQHGCVLPHSSAVHKKVGEMTICNCGSVGSPYDGDPRASYLLIDDSKPAIHRVEYDVEKEVGRLLGSDYPHKEWIAALRRSGSYVNIDGVISAQPLQSEGGEAFRPTAAFVSPGLAA